MVHLFLSGVGGSTNWLPFMLPLVAILGLIKGSELVREWWHRRKLASENNLFAHFPANDEPAKDQTSANPEQ
jgi:hypothetical protein